MKKTVNEKIIKIETKGKKSSSKKLSTKMKAVIYSVVAVVCVAAITLGLVFGLRKPGDPTYKFSASQQILANEINSNVQYDVFEIVGSVPYSQYTEIENLTRYGDSYFAYTDSYGNEQFFVYYEDANGETKTRCLTNSDEGFVDASALSWKVEKMNGDYLLIANFYDPIQYATTYVNVRFDLVSIKDPKNPIRIFQFDTKNKDININSYDFVLKNNYFAFTFINNIDFNTETYDVNTYFYAYSDEFIPYSVSDDNHFVGVMTESASNKVSRTYNDNGFVVRSNNKYKYYYLSNGEFNYFEQSAVIGNNSEIVTEYNFIELSSTKLLVEQVNYLADETQKTDLTVKTEVQADSGTYTYSNKNYELYNISNGSANKLQNVLRQGYPSIGKIEVDNLNTQSAFAIAYQKTDAENMLTDDYLIVYYDANGNEIVNYAAASAGEQIVYASNNTFVTTKNILQPQNNTNTINLFNFSNKDYFIDTDLAINSNYIVLSTADDSKAGIIDVWGNLVLDPETSGYTKILDLVDNKCVAYDNSEEKGYIVDLISLNKTELENYERNPLITGSGTGLNVSKDASTQLSKIKNTYGNVVAENVTDIKMPTSITGFKVLEIWTNDDNAKATSYVLFSRVGEDETASSTSYTKNGDVSYSSSKNVANAYSSSKNVASPYATCTWTITYCEDPSFTMEFTQGATMTTATSVSIWLDNTTYTLSNINVKAGASYQSKYSDAISVTYTNGNSATFVQAPHASISSWCLTVAWQYDYYKFFIFSSWSDHIEVKDVSIGWGYLYHYIYFKGTNDWTDDFNSNQNKVNTQTLTLDYFTTDLSTATSRTLTTPDEDYVYYGHSTHWRISGNSSAGNLGGSWYAPSAYNDSNVANSSYSLCNSYALNTSITVNFGAYFNMYLFAYYIQNTYTLKVDGSTKNSGLGVNKLSSAIYYPSKTGYNFTGWSYSGFGSGTHYARFYKSDGTYTDQSFSGSSGTISMKSGYSYIKIYNSAHPYNGTCYGFTASLTAQYTPKIYTINLVGDTTKTIVNGAQTAIYYKYDNGFYLDSACTIYRMTETENPITLPIAVGYKVETRYTFYDSVKATTYLCISATGYASSAMSNTTSSAYNTYIETDGVREFKYTWSAITYTIQYPVGCYLDDSFTLVSTTATYDSVVAIPAPVGMFYDFNGFSISGASTDCTHYYGSTTATSSSFTTATKSLNDYPSSRYFKNLWGTVDASKSASESHGTVTLTGNWLGKIYNVSYNMNGGNSITSHNVRYGTDSSINGTVYKVGYNFAGWDVSGMDTTATNPKNNSAVTVTHYFTPSGGTQTSCTTATTSLDASYIDCKFKNLRGTYGSSGTIQSVTFSAKWEPITYNITYSLTNGSAEAGKWISTESHPATAVYEQSFAVDVPDREGWPVGYDFVGWYITGLGSGAQSCPTQDGDYWYVGESTLTLQVNKRQYFKNLAADEGDTINFQARWEAHKYNISYDVNGERGELNSSSAKQASYDAYAYVYAPTRPGYTFAGWSFTKLSDDVTHYYYISSATSFESVNGRYVNANNPNELVRIGAGKNNIQVKNLHFESGATVTLVANWTPNTYTITYHYTTDADYSSWPTTKQINTASNQTHTKVQSVTFAQYFRTYSVGVIETDSTIIAPTGHKIAGWYMLMGSSLVSGADTAYQAENYPEIVATPNTDYLFYYPFVDNHLSSNSAQPVANMNAYAVYVAIDFTIKYYVPSVYDAANDLSTYVFNSQVTTQFGASITLKTSSDSTQYAITNWLVSSNLYVDGGLSDSYKIITYNSTTRYTYAGITLNWGISNILAHDPENPVFYLYGEVNPEYDARSLSKLTFNRVIDSTNGDYWNVKAKSTSITGAVYIPNRYNNGTYDLPVRKVSSSGFSSIASITSVYIPKNIETIDSYAFRNCDNLLSVTFEDDSKLKTINLYAFDGCMFKTFVMPNSVTSIGTNCFSYCSAMTSLTLSTSLKSLPAYFIEGTSNLTSLTIPNSVTSIDSFALSWSCITSLNVPANVTSIGFQPNHDLKSISVDENNKYFDSRNNCNAVMSADNTLIFGCVNTTIPDDTKMIGNFAFDGIEWKAGETAILPEGLTHIHDYAFEFATFTGIILPSTLFYIGMGAFTGAAITDIILPNAISVIYDYAFSGSALTSIVIPGDNAPYIGWFSFSDCTNLKTAIFKYGVGEIGNSTFQGCTSLEYVYIPSSTYYVQDSAFATGTDTNIYVGNSETFVDGYWDAGWLNGGSVEYNSDSDQMLRTFLSLVYPDWNFNSSTESYVCVTNYRGSETTVTIPAVVDEVDLGYSSASTALSNITSLYVGTNVKSFAYANTNSKLTTLTLSPGLQSLPDSAFSGLYYLKTITIPYTVSFIGKSIFVGNSSLTSIVVDERNSYFDSRDNCNAIINTATNTLIAGASCSTIPTSVVRIGSYAFSNFTKSSLTILGNVKVIESNAFDQVGISTLTIQEGVEELQSKAFIITSSCNVSLPSTITNLGISAIRLYHTNYQLTISVDSANEVYDSRDNCNAIIETATNKIVLGSNLSTIPSTVTAIGPYAFSLRTLPDSFTIPSTITTIEEYAFEQATFSANISVNVVEIDAYAFYEAIFNGALSMGSKLVEIGERAFRYASFNGQTSIEIPSNVKVIGAYAFADVEEEFVFNEGLQEIGEFAFASNGTTTSIVIPDSVIEIGQGAFSELPSLTYLDIGNGITKIPDYFVYGAGILESIVIPETITDIGIAAFYDCYNVLGTVIIPDSVVTIGDYAFFYLGSNGDVDVVFGKNITTIGQQAFYYSGINEVVLGDAVTMIRSKAFYECDQLTYVNLGNGAMSILSYGFAYCSNLADVVFSDNTVTISTYAFYNCSAIKKLNLPQNTNLYIDSYAFSYCTGITSLEIVYAKTINNYAFRYCTSLKYVWMGSGVSFIYASSYSSSPFYGCSALTAIYTNAASRPTNWETYWAYIASGTSKSVYNSTIATYYGVVYPDFKFSGNYGSIVLTDYTGTASTVYVPSFVVETGICAFEANTMTKVVFPDGFKKLGDLTFYNAKSLTEVVLPNSLTTIASNAFNGCISLMSINIPNSVTTIGERAFQSTKISSLYIPASVTSIGEGIFYWADADYSSTTNPHRYISVDPANTVYDSRDNCNAIIKTDTNTLVLGTPLTIIPNSVETIGSYAFCYNYFDTLTLPESVKYVGDNAFFGSDFNVLNMLGVRTIGYQAFYGNNLLQTLVFPETFTEFTGSNAFNSNTALQSVTLPDSLINLGSYTFSDCSALTTINIPKNITTIGVRTFSYCDALTEIHIPANITSIGNAAFYYCDSLTTVTMENGVTSIGEQAFYYCSNLVTMNMSSTVTSIGNKAFYNCTKLSTCVIPAGLTYLGEYAFASCKALTYVWVPSGASITASSATSGPFNQCSESLKIYTNATTRMSGWGTYWNYRNASAYFTPTYSSSYSTYFNKLYPNYSVYTSDSDLILSAYLGSETTVNIPHGITTIANYAFDSKTTIQTLNVPSSVNLIAYYAFYNCSNLKTLTLAEGVQRVSTDMIYGVNKLTTLCLPSTLISFSVTEMALYYTSLTTVNVAEGNDIIAVKDGYIIELKTNRLLMPINRNLTSYTIPAYIEEIGPYAFAHIESFTGALVIPKSVVEIEAYAFAYSSYISSISFETGSKLKAIREGAFYNNIKDLTISLPEGLEVIETLAFAGASGSTGITINIPSTVRAIGYEFIGGVVAAINVADGNSYYTDGNVGVLIDNVTKRLLAGNSTMTSIPTSVKTIGPFAFAGMFTTTAISISIPANVKAIDAYAFFECTKLSSVTFAEGLSEISYYAFAGCTSLTKLVLPNSLEHIDQYAFSGCSSLASVYIGSNVKFVYGSSYSTAPFYGAKTSLVIYCADLERPKAWGSYWNYLSSSVRATVVWGYDVASVQSTYVTGASAASAYNITSVDVGNAGHYGNISYDVEMAVYAVSRDTNRLDDEEYLEEIA